MPRSVGRRARPSRSPAPGGLRALAAAVRVVQAAAQTATRAAADDVSRSWALPHGVAPLAPALPHGLPAPPRAGSPTDGRRGRRRPGQGVLWATGGPVPAPRPGDGSALSTALPPRAPQRVAVRREDEPGDALGGAGGARAGGADDGGPAAAGERPPHEPVAEDLTAAGLPGTHEAADDRTDGLSGPSAAVRALVERAQAGDAEAFGELYDRYVDLVFRYVRYRVASVELAEDITSETFLRALRRIGSFSWQGRDIAAWFLTIARNLVTDHYKSSRARLETTTDDIAAAAPEPTLDGPEDRVLDGIRDRQLLEAVRRLGAEQQECIVLRFLQGLSVAETAQIMGKNDGAIKALQYRAVRALGRTLPEGLHL